MGDNVDSVGLFRLILRMEIQSSLDLVYLPFGGEPVENQLASCELGLDEVLVRVWHAFLFEIEEVHGLFLVVDLVNSICDPVQIDGVISIF